MSYTWEDFEREYADNFLESLPPEERLKGLPLQERLKGLPPEEVFKQFSTEIIEDYLKKHKQAQLQVEEQQLERELGRLTQTTVYCTYGNHNRLNNSCYAAQSKINELQ